MEGPKEALYALHWEQLEALLDGSLPPVSNLANASALLFQALPGLNWAGFYLLREGELVLGPFQGKPACTRIALDRGVCGAAARQNRVQNVPDVHAFPGHIACDGASKSEIVLPLHDANGGVAGVLDIDSPTLCRFDETDETALRQLVALIETRCDFSQTGYRL